MPGSMELLLASASPRRRELLQQIGVPFRVVNHGVSEAVEPGETPRDYVLRTARDKAADVSSRLAADRRAVVLAADTIVVLDGEILGKPRDGDDAQRILERLSARTHTVYTAVAVHSSAGREAIVSESQVTFRALAAHEIRAYWASGEPEDKAGAYAIQGFGAVFINRIEGSYSGVVGLPLCETAELLQRHGVACWRPAQRQGEAQQ